MYYMLCIGTEVRNCIQRRLFHVDSVYSGTLRDFRYVSCIHLYEFTSENFINYSIPPNLLLTIDYSKLLRSSIVRKGRYRTMPTMMYLQTRTRLLTIVLLAFWHSMFPAKKFQLSRSRNSNWIILFVN